MNQPARRRRGDLAEELARLEPPRTPDQVAAVAARHAIKRLKLADDKRTWATLKAVIAEAMAHTLA